MQICDKEVTSGRARFTRRAPICTKGMLSILSKAMSLVEVQVTDKLAKKYIVRDY